MMSTVSEDKWVAYVAALAGGANNEEALVIAEIAIIHKQTWEEDDEPD